MTRPAFPSGPPLTRWWVSWVEPAKPPEDAEDADGYVEIICGGDTGIVRTWVTGWLMTDYMTTSANLCAVVDAATIKDAMRIIRSYYQPKTWRFCDPQEPGWMPPSGRFP
jgi:hypothetical protein